MFNSHMNTQRIFSRRGIIAKLTFIRSFTRVALDVKVQRLLSFECGITDFTLKRSFARMISYVFDHAWAIEGVIFTRVALILIGTIRAGHFITRSTVIGQLLSGSEQRLIAVLTCYWNLNIITVKKKLIMLTEIRFYGKLDKRKLENKIPI